MKPANCQNLRCLFFVAAVMACFIPAKFARGQADDGSATNAVETNLKRMNQAVTAGEFKIARAYMTEQGATEVIGDLAGIAISLADPSINDSFPAQFDNFKEEFKQILEAAGLTTQWDALNKDPREFEKFQALASNADGLKVLDKLLNAAAAMPWNGFEFRGDAAKTYQHGDNVFTAIRPEDEKEFGETGLTSVYRFIPEDDMWKFDGSSESETEAYNKKLAAMPPTLKDVSFNGETASGEKVTFADYKGKVVLFDFWGTWCAPCVAKLPKLEKIHAAFKKYGFEIIGVPMDDAETVNEFYKTRTLPWKNVVDPDGELKEKFGVKVYPTTMLLDKSGKHIDSNMEEDELVDELVKLFKLDAADFEALKLEVSKKPNKK